MALIETSTAKGGRIFLYFFSIRFSLSWSVNRGVLDSVCTLLFRRYVFGWRVYCLSYWSNFIPFYFVLLDLFRFYFLTIFSNRRGTNILSWTGRINLYLSSLSSRMKLLTSRYLSELDGYISRLGEKMESYAKDVARSRLCEMGNRWCNCSNDLLFEVELVRRIWIMENLNGVETRYHQIFLY